MVSDEEARAKVQAYLADGGEFIPPEYKRQDGTKDWPRMWGEIEYFEENDKPKKKKKKEDEAVEVCFIQDGENLYHQTKNGFVNQNGEYFQELTIKGVKYRPIHGEEVEKGKIKLPEKLEPHGSFKALIEDSTALIRKYVDVPEDFVKITAFYAALTWFQDKFRTVPYWRVKGDWGTGKSRAWEVAYNLCCNPIPVSGALTSAPVFRIIEKWGILTLAIDETDLSNGDTTSDLVKIINTGYERTGGIMRCNQNDASDIQFFGTFCPKLFSMRFPFEDAATESRCLSQDTKRTAREDIPVELTTQFDVDAAKLRNRFLDYRLKKYPQIKPVENPVFPAKLEGRLKQIAKAFYPLLETKEDIDWFNAWLVGYQRKLREERAATFEGTILQIIRDQAGEFENADALDEISYPTTKTVADALGNGVKYQTIAKTTKALGFISEFRKSTIGGKQKGTRALVISKEKWFEVCDRYSPDGVTERPSLLVPFSEIPTKITQTNLSPPVSTVSTVSTISESPSIWENPTPN